jgi:DDE family transposase
MDASDLIRALPEHPREEGDVHIIKESKGAIKWTRLSCRSFAANAVRLQLHALAYNLRNFMRTPAMPKAAEPRSLTSQRDKLI